VASLSRKLSLLEDDYEKSQASLKAANERVHELTISSDESERFVTTLVSSFFLLSLPSSLYPETGAIN